MAWRNVITRKFRITTERYSMGESVKVFWTDGPASDKVDPVVKKYESVSTDPVTSEILSGGNSYAFAQRTISEKVKKMEMDEARKKVVNFEHAPDWDPALQQYLWDKIKSTDYPPAEREPY